MNYLASPPLVVAYALAGHDGHRPRHRPARRGRDGAAGLPARHLAVEPARSPRRSSRRCSRTCSARSYAEVFDGDEHWHSLEVPERRPLRLARVDLRAPAAVLRGHAGRRRSRRPTSPARACSRVLGDSVTTDHISPAGSIKRDSPAGRYLQEHGVEPAGLQLLRRAARQPRGDDARHVRQHPPAQPARRPRRERAARGRLHAPSARRRGALDLRRGDALRRRRACRSSCSAARSTAPAPRATGPRRARACSASAPSSPRASSASTAPTSSAWACCRCSSRRARASPRSG